MILRILCFLVIAGVCSAETNDRKILQRRAHLAHEMVSCVMTPSRLSEATLWGAELFRDLCDEPSTAETGTKCLVLHWSNQPEESIESLQRKYLRALNIQKALKNISAAACEKEKP